MVTATRKIVETFGHCKHNIPCCVPVIYEPLETGNGKTESVYISKQNRPYFMLQATELPGPDLILLLTGHQDIQPKYITTTCILQI